jgi:hypothetical protein
MKPIRPNLAGAFPRLPSAEPVEVALGNGSQFTIAIVPNDGRVLIAVEGKGAYTFGHTAHPSYVQEKLKVMNGDAVNLADLINDQLFEPGSIPRHGYYYPTLCNKETQP